MVPRPQDKARMTRALRRCALLAEHIYEIDLSEMRITYELDNDHLAEAHINSRRSVYGVRVNPHYLAMNPSKMADEVAPHEVAHLVAFLKEDPKRPWKHGPRWREAVRALGGEGDECVDPAIDD